MSFKFRSQAGRQAKYKSKHEQHKDCKKLVTDHIIGGRKLFVDCGIGEIDEIGAGPQSDYKKEQE